MLQYDGIDISERIDINKTKASEECDICHYWYFLDKNFKYEPSLCRGCYDLMQKAMNFIDATIASIKDSDFRFYFWYMNKDDAINRTKNSNLNEDKYNVAMDPRY